MYVVYKASIGNEVFWMLNLRKRRLKEYYNEKQEGI